MRCKRVLHMRKLPKFARGVETGWRPLVLTAAVCLCTCAPENGRRHTSGALARIKQCKVQEMALQVQHKRKNVLYVRSYSLVKIATIHLRRVLSRWHCRHA